MNRLGLFAACLLVTCSQLSADSGQESGTLEFNAVDGVPGVLMVAVGDNGLIVHFPAGETPRRTPSGTDRDLLDVHVAASDFAVAVGSGIVLIWDGVAWTPVVTEENPVPHAQAWAFPDQGLLLYGEGNAASYRLCPRKTGTERQPFCRRFAAPLRAACGGGDDITLLLANGEFYRVNDTLMAADGSFEPAFRPRNSMELKSAWLPENSSNLQAGLPEAFAVSANGKIMRFDGNSWRSASGWFDALMATQVTASDEGRMQRPTADPGTR